MIPGSRILCALYLVTPSDNTEDLYPFLFNQLMKMLGVTSGGIVFAGCVLFASCLYVSATCPDLEQCFTKLGTNLGSLAGDPADVIELLCQRQYLLIDCYPQFATCSTYKSYADFFPNKNEIQAQLKVVCNRKDEYKKTVLCVIDTAKSISRSAMQRMISCTQDFMQAGGSNMTLEKKCTLTEQLVSCSDVMKSLFLCSAKLAHIISDSGIHVPCMDIYSSLTSGSEPLVWSLILLSYCVIAIFTKLY